MNDKELIPAYDEKLAMSGARQFSEKGKPLSHSRWREKSNVPRYSKPQEQWIGKNLREADGWRQGARVYA